MTSYVLKNSMYYKTLSILQYEHEMKESLVTLCVIKKLRVISLYEWTEPEPLQILWHLSHSLFRHERQKAESCFPNIQYMWLQLAHFPVIYEIQRFPSFEQYSPSQVNPGWSQSQLTYIHVVMMGHVKVHILNHEGTMTRFTFWFNVCNDLTPMNTINKTFQTTYAYF